MRLSKFDERLFSDSIKSATMAERAFIYDRSGKNICPRPDSTEEFEDDACSSPDRSWIEIFSDGSLYHHTNADDEIWANADDFARKIADDCGPVFSAENYDGKFLISRGYEDRTGLYLWRSYD